jgi:vacuolar iron transporter family protein
MTGSPKHALAACRSRNNRHARLLRAITSGSRAGLEGGHVAQLEGRHRAIGGNSLRAAVLGANDGLLSNLSLVMGVAGGFKGSAVADRPRVGELFRLQTPTS